MANGSGRAVLALTFAAVAVAAALWSGGRISVLASDRVIDQGPASRARGDVRDARRFASPSVEQVVQQACASAGAFVVLDSFNFFRPANLDDDIVDPQHPETARIGHGDLVVAIARQAHPNVTSYQIDPVFNVFTLARDMKRLVDDIESGKIGQPAAVISSIVLPVDLDDINRRLPDADRISTIDVAVHKDRALAVLVGDAGEDHPYRMVRDAIARLNQRGVPVFVAAGNTAPDTLVNMLALNEGVYAVGALDAHGRETAYTSAPDMVALWAPGQVVVTEADGGLSLNRSAEVAFPQARMAEQKALLANYVGRDPAALALRIPAELAMLSPRSRPAMRMSVMRRALAPGLYRTSDLLAAYGYPRTSGNVQRSLEQGDYMHFPSDTIFKVDAAGRLAFDPLDDGGPGQLVANDATSFAAPNICPPRRTASLVARGVSDGR